MNQNVLVGEISYSTSLNRFSYVNGDPVGKIDPSGNIAVVAWLIKAGIDGITDLLMQVTVNYYFNPQTKHDFKKSFNEVNWWQVARSMGESLIGAPGGRLGRAIVAGTLISTKAVLKPIETVKEGDYVYAEDPETGKKGLKRAVQTFVNEKGTLVEVVIGEIVIKTTEGHPFWVEGGGWLGAENLKPGDRVRLESGAIAVVQSVKLIHLKTPVKVYNFEVEDFHTYYVSELKVLVHNTCGGDSVVKSVKSVLKDVELPTSGKIRYIPPANWTPSQPLPKKGQRVC